VVFFVLSMVTYCFEYVDGRVPAEMEMYERYTADDFDSYYYRTEDGFNIAIRPDADLHDVFKVNLRAMVDSFGFESVRGLRLLGVYERGKMGEHEYRKGNLVRASESVRSTLKHIFRNI
jgi:hypothetical protein